MFISVNGTQIKSPSTFKIERYNVTNMQRLANADMAGDLIAKKKKFYFTYDAITSYELDAILDAIWGSKLFFELKYDYEGVRLSNTVYVGSIPSELHRTGAVWIWKNVTFNLIQK